jgi:hypothetical protein
MRLMVDEGFLSENQIDQLHIEITPEKLLGELDHAISR